MTEPDVGIGRLTPDEVRRAAERIAGRVARTPTVELPDDDVLLHLEYLQLAGTVKYRGALNRLLAEAERGPVERVVAASGGNAAVGAALAARTVGVPARVFVPSTTPTQKVLRLAKLGADVVQIGTTFPEAYEAAVEEGHVADTAFIHPYDQVEVCAGNGTVAFDLTTSRIDTVLVSVAGGSLLAGITMGLRAAGRDGVRVIGVETQGCATLAGALEAGIPVEVPISGIAADSLGAPALGLVPFEVVRSTGAGSVVVSDEDAIAAREELFAERRILVEHGSAAAYAALHAGHYVPAPGERVLVVLCGANTPRE